MKSRLRSYCGTLAKVVGFGCTVRVFNDYFYFLVKLEGQSMEPTFHTGDFVIGERYPRNVSYGNILVARSPSDPNEYVVKRLAGLPGDVKHFGFLSLSKIPEGHMWLEGDNASVSKDSRVYGPVPQGLIVGRILYKVWPLSDVGAV
ncbi:hypothetical protein ONE63_005270 [Megalurothrips usitatus]|uniref:Peptidase S26 domain-containing protein n=1 Tax=Megalurothrips usitatus TaxID=439358 RepID=A0AAV7XZ01_9NEOP|nr:hypothetical protein ONE63_005270 [Megalurothrips usitatus]